MMSSAEDRQRRRYESNLERLRSVFHQLGNWSGFLPLDLVDEAIQLLTDNRLNFSGVVGCLQQLKIGSVYVHERGHAVGALEKLGLRKDSAVCDIQASSAFPQTALVNTKLTASIFMCSFVLIYLCLHKHVFLYVYMCIHILYTIDVHAYAHTQS